MSWFAGWPALAVIALAVVVGVRVSESRIYYVVNRLLLPVHCEGVLLQDFYFNAD